MNIKISIIIPTYDRDRILGNALNSINRQKVDYDLFEVIVVDNGSIDNTKLVCSEFQRNNENIIFSYLYDEEPGLLTGRHAGASQAKGEVLCFIDDDVELSSTWLSTIMEVMQNELEIMVLTGPNMPKFESYPPEWLKWFFNTTPYGGKMCGWLSLLDLGSDKIEIDPNFVWGLNFIVRKSAFIELGGFHPDIVPAQLQKLQGDGETGLTLKAKDKGLKALYHPGVMLYHNVPASRMTYEYFDKRSFYQGVCDSFTAIRRRYGLYKSKLDNTNSQNKNIYFRSRKSNLFKNLYKKLFYSKKSGNILSNEINALSKRFGEKQTEGYNFHQKAVNNDPKLMEWVLKDNYWNYKLPI